MKTYTVKTQAGRFYEIEAYNITQAAADANDYLNHQNPDDRIIAIWQKGTKI